MNSKGIFFGKIIAAQILAFLVSSYLVNHVFAGPIPAVRAEFKEEIKQLPQVIAENIKKIPELIQKTPDIVLRSSQEGRGRLPSAWVPDPNAMPKPPSETLPQNPPTATPLPQRDETLTVTPVFRSPTTPERAPTAFPTTRPQATPTNEPPQGGGSGSALEMEMLTYINQKRSQEGAAAVSINVQLAAAARNHSVDMGSKGFCEHTGSNGSQPPARAQQVGFKGTYVGETIGCKYKSAQAIVDAWWNSPGHHRVLSDKRGRVIGLGWSNNYQTAVVGY